MLLSDVRFQDAALGLIRSGLRNQRTPHAYLFAGSAGVGKEMTARALAARLLCEARSLAPEADACGKCRSCRLVQSDNHPDLHMVHRGLHKLHPERSVRATRGLFITVDVIRHFLLEHAALRPQMGRRRIFILRDAERMNEDAQNAMLKTLEEPAGETCLILISSSAQRLLSTIRSRCQLINFGLLPREFVRAQLAQRGAAPASALLLASLAQGRMGVAERWHAGRLLDCVPALAATLERFGVLEIEGFAKSLLEQAAALASRLSGGKSQEDAELAETADEQDADEEKDPKATPTDQLRDALKLVLMLVSWILRDGMLRQEGADALSPLASGLGVRAATPQVLEGRWLDGIEAIVSAEAMLDRNVAPQLTCERLACVLSGAVAP